LLILLILLILFCWYCWYCFVDIDGTVDQIAALNFLLINVIILQLTLWVRILFMVRCTRYNIMW
jgi:hypothetical protein